MASQLDRIDERTQLIESRINKIEGLLVGNGRAGLVVRMDRLEQFVRNRVWIERTLVIAAVGSIFTFVASAATLVATLAMKMAG